MKTLLITLLPAVCFAQAPHRIVIQTSTILDGKGGVLKNQQIVIEGSHIRTIAPGKAKPDYDLRGLTVMPGWIDTHIHLNWHLDAANKSLNNGGKPEDMALATAADAWITLFGGFTTVQSVGAAIDGAVRDIVNRGILPGPRILTSLRQIQGTSQDKTRPEPEALRELVRKTKQEGADVIKLFATTGLGAGGDQSIPTNRFRPCAGKPRPWACAPWSTPSATPEPVPPCWPAAPPSSMARLLKTRPWT
jgi:imidazolonepropionase-like amidohydrolase